jgi:hypothetical protein
MSYNRGRVPDRSCHDCRASIRCSKFRERWCRDRDRPRRVAGSGPVRARPSARCRGAGISQAVGGARVWHGGSVAPARTVPLGCVGRDAGGRKSGRRSRPAIPIPAALTTVTGERHSSAWSPTKASPIVRRSSAIMTRGSTPAGRTPPGASIELRATDFAAE